MSQVRVLPGRLRRRRAERSGSPETGEVAEPTTLHDRGHGPKRVPVNLLAACAIVAVVAVAVTAMLLVRRRAPEGSYFTDGDRASGVFGVLATGFSVLLGFIIFLAFTSYDQSRSRRRDRGARGAPAGRGGAVPPAAVARSLTGELSATGATSPGRNGTAWRPAPGRRHQPVGGRAVRDAQDGRAADRRREQSAYDKWLDLTSTREEARRDRIHGAEGVIPSPLWIVLFVHLRGDLRLHAVLRRPRERAVTQAVLMGSVAAVITPAAAPLAFLDNPFRLGCRDPGAGGDGAVAADHRRGAPAVGRR